MVKIRLSCLFDIQEGYKGIGWGYKWRGFCRAKEKQT